jgi:predicted nucleic acid-binding Zn ribbon protein
MAEALTAHKRNRARFGHAAERAGKLKYADPQIRREMRLFVSEYPREPIVKRLARDSTVDAPTRREPVARSRERRATTRRTADARGDPDEPAPPRACAVCGGSLDGKYSNAKTCGDRCRQRLRRERAALLKRYDAALGIVRTLKRPAERFELFCAVVAPSDPRLATSSLREAA